MGQAAYQGHGDAHWIQQALFFLGVSVGFIKQNELIALYILFYNALAVQILYKKNLTFFNI